MSNETKSDKPSEMDKHYEAFQAAKKTTNRFYLKQAQFVTGVQVLGELLTHYDVNTKPYTAWADFALGIVIFVHKTTGDVFFTSIPNTKAGWLAKVQ